MKTLLRQTSTGFYLQAPGAWTKDPNQALDFRFVDRAMQHVQLWAIEGVELAFAFDDPQFITTASLEKTAVHYATL